MCEIAIAQNLINKILELPKEKILEVQDFVEYLSNQNKKNGISPNESGLTLEESFILRSKLSTFVEDWESPEMDIYDKL